MENNKSTILVEYIVFIFKKICIEGKNLCKQQDVQVADNLTY